MAHPHDRLAAALALQGTISRKMSCASFRLSGGGTEPGVGTVTSAAAVPALAKTSAPMFSARNDLDMVASFGSSGR
jgi:hypothetical protein